MVEIDVVSLKQGLTTNLFSVKRNDNSMKLFNKLYLSLLITVVAQAVGAATPIHAEMPVVEIAKVSQPLGLPGRRYPAKLISPAVLNATSQIDGRIAKINFKEGDQVKAGDVLFELERQRYEVSHQKAESSFLKAKATERWAEQNLHRIEALIERNATSKASLEEAQKTFAESRATLQEAKATLQLAKDDLDNTKICATFDGRVGVSNVVLGSLVRGNETILTTVVQTNPMRIRFSVGLRDVLERFSNIERLKLDGRVRLKLADGKNYGYIGRVIFVDNSAHSDTDTVDVYAEIENPKEVLVALSTVSIELFHEHPTTQVTIPRAAVQHDASSAWVWVLDDKNIPTKRPIVVGRTVGTTQYVVSGLISNERVVSDGTHKVIEGQPVAVALTKGDQA